jgi:hypothetical protein
MLRNWHNNRAILPTWKKFSLALVISNEPSLLIADLTQSPFNVGGVVELEDFSEEDVWRMNLAHGTIISRKSTQQLHGLLGGQPYLCRRAFYELSQARYNFEQLLSEADSETGPFGDHLRALLSRLGRKTDLLRQLKLILQTAQCDDAAARYRLTCGGLINEKAGKLKMRNALYDRYFRRVFLG